jgi:Ca2+:H+ antiporter
MTIPSNIAPSTQAVVNEAHAAAIRLNHEYIGTEHLLLALLASSGRTHSLFQTAGIDAPLLKEALERRMPKGRSRAATAEAELSYRTGARRALESAAEEARTRGDAHVEPIHLLLALVTESRGILGACFGEAGVKPNAVRAALGGDTKPRSDVPAARNRPRRAAREGVGLEPRAASPRAEPIRAESHPALTQSPPARRGGIASRITWRHVLLLSVPVSLALKVTGAGSPIVVFLTACAGVLPLAAYMGDATEHLAHRTNATLGGLLNATFGNAAELIIALIALQAGLIDLVKASITGSILGNLLLILGLSLTAGGMRKPVLKFSRTTAGMSSAMLVLAVVGLVFPAIFHQMHPRAGVREIYLSEAVAVVLVLTYGASLLFSLKTHKNCFGATEHPVEGPVWSTSRALLVLGAATAGVAFESEVLVHATEQVTAVLGLSQTFLGLVVIPLIGNAAEHATAVVMARKGKIDLSLGIALGSSTQVALLVAPILVFAGVLMGRAMDLVFSPFEVAALGLATIVTAVITLDGESHWFEGVQLLAVYALMAVAAYFI